VAPASVFHALLGNPAFNSAVIPAGNHCWPSDFGAKAYMHPSFIGNVVRCLNVVTTDIVVAILLVLPARALVSRPRRSDAKPRSDLAGALSRRATSCRDDCPPLKSVSAMRAAADVDPSRRYYSADAQSMCASAGA
jgi:hypothetical protein